MGYGGGPRVELERQHVVLEVVPPEKGCAQVPPLQYFAPYVTGYPGQELERPVHGTQE